MLLKALWRLQPAGGERRFSTLYRVDAIEADDRRRHDGRAAAFQYPLSGRCY